MRSTILLNTALLFLAGCALQEKPELALACQTKECVCLPSQMSYPLKGEPAPVQWRPNGDAYCTEGYVLRLVEKKTY